MKIYYDWEQNGERIPIRVNYLLYLFYPELIIRKCGVDLLRDKQMQDVMINETIRIDIYKSAKESIKPSFFGFLYTKAEIKFKFYVLSTGIKK